MEGEQNFNSSNKSANVPHGSTPKKYKLVMGLFMVFVLLIGLVIIARAYEKWRGMEEIEKIADAMKQYENEILESHMADTYGGKTPQETLQLYISAVEGGDYELASKYFVVGGQERELNSLMSAPEENTKRIQGLLREIVFSEDGFSISKKEYTVRKPIFVSFVKYPNGIWKISEI